MFLLKRNYWQIKKTKVKGYGVFAKIEIAAGTIIGDYLGKVLKTAEYDLDSDKNGLYLMFFTDQASIYPDLNTPGIHLLNHSCKPNCWIYTYKDHTLFFTLRKINSKEELTISYLLAPKRKSCILSCLHICRCGSKNCTGTMHLSEEKYQLWQDFQDKENKSNEKVKVVFNKNLPKLPSYPKLIPTNPIYPIICPD